MVSANWFLPFVRRYSYRSSARPSVILFVKESVADATFVLGRFSVPVSLICARRKNLPVRAATDDSVSFLTLLFHVFKSQLNRISIREIRSIRELDSKYTLDFLDQKYSQAMVISSVTNNSEISERFLLSHLQQNFYPSC